MSAVDVLAVIGILASIVRTDNGNKYPEINTLLDDAEKARAAVAELIEAAAGASGIIGRWRLTGEAPGLSEWMEIESRLDAALACVGGAA